MTAWVVSVATSDVEFVLHANVHLVHRSTVNGGMDTARLARSMYMLLEAGHDYVACPDTQCSGLVRVLRAASRSQL